MKFYIRRAVAGIVAMPVIAGTYFVGYLALVGFGAESGLFPVEAWNNGILIGAVCAVALVFAPNLDKFISKIVGE